MFSVWKIFFFIFALQLSLGYGDFTLSFQKIGGKDQKHFFNTCANSSVADFMASKFLKRTYKFEMGMSIFRMC